MSHSSCGWAGVTWPPPASVPDDPTQLHTQDQEEPFLAEAELSLWLKPCFSQVTTVSLVGRMLLSSRAAKHLAGAFLLWKMRQASTAGSHPRSLSRSRAIFLGTCVTGVPRTLPSPLSIPEWKLPSWGVPARLNYTFHLQFRPYLKFQLKLLTLTFMLWICRLQRCLPSVEMFRLTCKLFVHLVFLTHVQNVLKICLVFLLKAFFNFWLITSISWRSFRFIGKQLSAESFHLPPTLTRAPLISFWHQWGPSVMMGEPTLVHHYHHRHCYYSHSSHQGSLSYGFLSNAHCHVSTTAASNTAVSLP